MESQPPERPSHWPRSASYLVILALLEATELPEGQEARIKDALWDEVTKWGDWDPERSVDLTHLMGMDYLQGLPDGEDLIVMGLDRFMPGWAEIIKEQIDGSEDDPEDNITVFGPKVGRFRIPANLTLQDAETMKKLYDLSISITAQKQNFLKVIFELSARHPEHETPGALLRSLGIDPHDFDGLI